MKTLFFGLVFFLLAAGAAPAQDKAGNQAIADAFVAAVNAGDLAGVMAVYADDAVVLPSGAPMAGGRAAIEAFWKQTLQQVSDFKVTVTEVKPLGEAAMREIGTFSLMTKGDKPEQIVGKYVAIIEKQGEEWKITTDIWNEDK